MKKLLLAAALFVTACTDSSGALRALHAAGFTNVELDGFPLWGCDAHDDFATKFTATNPRGERVSGVVCCGVYKDCTIRF